LHPQGKTRLLEERGKIYQAKVDHQPLDLRDRGGWWMEGEMSRKKRETTKGKTESY